MLSSDKCIIMKVMELEYSKSSGGTKAAALPVSPICIDFQVEAPVISDQFSPNF